MRSSSSFADAAHIVTDERPDELDNETRRALLRRLRNAPIDAPHAAYPHTVNIPSATYAPWVADEAFQRVYAAARSHTLVDVYRCHELWELARRQCLVKGDVIEVGTWRGGTGSILAAGSAADPAKTVFLCDTFAGVVKAGAHDTRYVGGEHSDATIDDVESVLSSLRLTNARILEGVFPEETGALVADRSFALCHIDVDVYASARDVFDWVAPRLSMHGIVVFDDYGFLGCEGITRLVEELDDDTGFFTYRNLNGHAVMVKLADRRDR
jgi:O-methyltransferase